MGQFSPLNIALALSVVRSKPDGITIQEHIHQICQHKTKGRRQSLVRRSDNHLILPHPWKAKCVRLEADVDRLRKELLGVRHELEEATAQSPIHSDIVSNLKVPKKRKSTVNGIHIDSTEGLSKKSKTTEDSFVMSNHIAAHEHGRKLMLELYALHKMFSETTPDHVKLTRSLCKCASAFNAALRHSLVRVKDAESYRAKLETDQERCSRTEKLMRSFGRSYASIMHGLDLLDISSNDPGGMGQVIYELIQVFSEALTIICSLASAEPISTGSRDGSQRARKPNLQSKSGVSEVEGIHGLLTGMLYLLDPAKIIHEDIFEGILFTLIRRIGELLYLFNFSYIRTNSTARDIRAAPAGAKELQDASIAAPYLVDLLQLALSRSPKSLRPISRQNGTVGQASTLGDVARRKLQRTLITCTFGVEGVPKEALADCLRMSTPKGPIAQANKASRKGKATKQSQGEWFTGEVWAMIGWDILGEEGDLADMAL